MGERRRGKRYKRRLQVKFGLEDTNNVGFIEDISSTGVRIKTNSVFKPGSTITMAITDESARSLMFADGLVMWARKVPVSMMHRVRCGMGVTYLKIDAVMHQFLVDLKKEDETGSG